MKINYRFISDMGENFEAEIQLGEGRLDSNASIPSVHFFSDEDVIPAGVSITTEQYVVGVVLKQIGEDYSKNL